MFSQVSQDQSRTIRNVVDRSLTPGCTATGRGRPAREPERSPGKRLQSESQAHSRNQQVEDP
jgi:hypothetical protein